MVLSQYNKKSFKKKRKLISPKKNQDNTIRRKRKQKIQNYIEIRLKFIETLIKIDRKQAVTVQKYNLWKKIHARSVTLARMNKKGRERERNLPRGEGRGTASHFSASTQNVTERIMEDRRLVTLSFLFIYDGILCFKAI